MSKAEELAEKAYPEGDIYIFGDASIACQVAYVKGYHQVEKDNELTWEDIRKIVVIYENVLNDKDFNTLPIKDGYTEVLKRFKAQKREEI